jgi:uncharacterized protein involved in exopolysaccharide biosynthesis
VSPPAALSGLANDLRRLIPRAPPAGAAAHPDGILLLLSALAMGAFALSGFALLRRLKRYERQAR